MKGLRIGNVFGVAIHIDWSWIFIALLVTLNLSVVFGNLHPNWGLALRWGVALIAALLFFASVLAHEMSHSLTARAQGMPVRRITLFLFGGVSNIERRPPSPRAEFLLSIVGPITSIVLGLVFTALGSLIASTSVATVIGNPSQAAAQIDPAATLLLWLGPVNIFVGVFNLIPGFPLDGGRIVRSILWAITENLRQATRWASWLGQAIAWMLIAVGIMMVFDVRVPILGTGFVNGLWLAFIGMFLNSAAVQSYRQVVVQDILEEVPVARLMRSNPPTVSPDCSISNLVEDHIMGTDDHAFPVMDDDKLAGMVALEDVRQVSRDKWDSLTVREIMTPVEDLVSISSEADAAEALNKLRQRDVRQLPVMRDGDLAGLLRRRDIVQWLQLQSEGVV